MKYLLFLILVLKLSYVSSQEDYLVIEYTKCNEKYISEKIKGFDGEFDIETISKEYIEYKLSPFFHVDERYSLIHEGINKDSVEINFNYNKIKEVELINFENSDIKYLDLSIPNLSIFPSSVFKIKHLEELDLTNDSYDNLPIGISKLKKLKRLSFGHTPIKKLPKDFKKLRKLEYLNINFSSIEDKEAFFETLALLPNLKSLELWSVDSETKLPESFLKLKKLKRFSLLGSEFNFTLVYQLKKLEELDLNLSSFQTFSSEIKNLKKLKHLSISRSSYIQNLPIEVAELKSLEYLKIDYGLGNPYYHGIKTNDTYNIICKLENLEELYLGDYF
ncbi:MAG: leucine-rich repeat domain-containing protein, partial [Ignavibacteriae bacterium]|nr:leucine-rich repeat domain-containing protein [Ignavibacteriota bacterium]